MPAPPAHHSITIDNFVDLVREYKRLIEDLDGTTAHGFLSSCATILPRIYVAGLLLPSVEPDSEFVDRSVSLSNAGVAALLGKHDHYFEVPDPHEDEPAAFFLISCDLVEIYADLMRPLVAFDAGHRNRAVWDWKFNIRGHCGDHIFDSMRPIHRLVHDHMSPDYVAGEGRCM